MRERQLLTKHQKLHRNGRMIYYYHLPICHRLLLLLLLFYLKILCAYIITVEQKYIRIIGLLDSRLIKLHFKATLDCSLFIPHVMFSFYRERRIIYPEPS